MSPDRDDSAILPSKFKASWTPSIVEHTWGKILRWNLSSATPVLTSSEFFGAGGGAIIVTGMDAANQDNAAVTVIGTTQSWSSGLKPLAQGEAATRWNGGAAFLKDDTYHIFRRPPNTGATLVAIPARNYNMNAWFDIQR